METTPAGGKSPLVLIVDDDMTLRFLVRESLEQAGFTVAEAANGAQGLALFEREQPDIVLLDVNMPEMDGFTVCAELRKTDIGERIPVLMMTGLDDIESINQAYEAGATDFITKPINWTLLTYRVRYMLRARQVHDALQRRLIERTAVAEIGRAITASLELEDVLALIAEQTRFILGTEHAALIIQGLDAKETGLRFVTRSGMSTSSPVHFQPRNARDGTVAMALATGQPAWSSDLPNDPAFDLAPGTRTVVEAAGYHACLAVPLLAGSRILGALFVARETAGQFTSDEIALLQTFADQAAVALENATLYADAQRRQREAEVMADLAQEINASLDLDAVLQRVVDGAQELCRCDAARIALRAPEMEEAKIQHQVGNYLVAGDQLRITPGQGIGGQVLRTHQPQRIMHQAADPQSRVASAAPDYVASPVAQLAVPIRIGDRISGLLLVDNYTAQAFTDREEGILQQLAAHTAIAIQNTRLFNDVQSQAAQLEQANTELRREIVERQRTQEYVEHLAHHDTLTNLPNRALLQDRIEQAILQTHRDHGQMAVLFIDLDRFKTINDSLGHPVGDKLLQEVGKRLSTCLRATDTVARVGGDEFVVVLRDLRRTTDPSKVATKLLASLAERFVIDSHELYISGSIGISLYPQDGENAQELMKYADAAMYHAKALGRNTFQRFTTALKTQASERLAMENHLRRALEREEFRLYYQPQVDIGSNHIVGMEALIRWQHPEMGFVSPGNFIPLAEETGLIVPIGEWVLRTACAQNRAWQDADIRPIRVAVNLSALQFQDKNLEEKIAQILEQTGLDPQYLELEITESVLMKNLEDVESRLHALSDMGISLSIDDFGTGYSSLSYLKRFPIHKLKIDQSFVRDMIDNTNDMAIVNAIITMAHSMSLRAVAEGVETAEQLALLQEQHCDSYQGYFLSRPVPADEIPALLAT